MASPVEALREAGFSDDEVNAWATDRRATLSAGGFKDNEIDAYFAGSVTVPDAVPKPFVQRFSQEAGDVLADVEKAMGATAKGRVFSAFAEGAAAGWGEPSLRLSDEDVKGLQDIGIFNKPDQWDAMTGVRFANEAMIRPAYGALAAAFKGLNAAIYGAGAAGGQVLGEIKQAVVGGEGEAELARARRDGAHLAVVATLVGGGNPVARTRRGPTGEPVTETIGTLPKAEDFANAARVIGDEAAPMAVQEKMLRLWEEKGVHPAEMAADAARDPVLRQKLLSADAADLPYRSETVIEINGKRTLLRDGKVVEGVDPPESIPTFTPRGETIIEINGERTVIRDGQIVEGGGGGRQPPREPPAPPPEGSYEAAQKAVLDRISVGDRTDRMSVSETIHKIYTEAVDDLHPIARLDDEAYRLARLTRGQAGKAQHFLNASTFDFNTLANNGRSLQDILAPLKDDLNGLRAYAAAKHGLELEAGGKKTGIPLDAAERVVGPEGARYETVLRGLVDYQNRLLKYLKDSGVLSQNAYDAMVASPLHGAHVPFYRVITPEQVPASKGLGPGNPVHRLKGSDRTIIDPIESIIKNTYAYISIAERNAAGIAIVDVLERQGMRARFERVTADPELANHLRDMGVTRPEELAGFVDSMSAHDGTTISAWRDGKKVSIKVDDPELVRAFRALDRETVGWLVNLLAAPAKGLRAGTIALPDFIGRNVMRDMPMAFVQSMRGIFSPIDTIKGLKSAITLDKHYEMWVKSGGANAEMVAMDRRYLQQSLAELSDQTGLMKRAWNNPLVNPYKGLQLLSQMIEEGTRIGEFRKVAKGATTKEEFQKAGFSSREVTIDFARRGAQMRAYSMIEAFGNPTIQGTDRLTRAFIDRPVNTSIKIAAGITLPSVLLWLRNHDDPRYQELPDWQKNLFWIFLTDDWQPVSAIDARGVPPYLLRSRNGQTELNKGTIWRYPKPHEAGVLFGSSVERILDQTLGKNPEALEGWWKSFVSVVTPPIIPTFAQPIAEQYANRSTFTDRTLIPGYLEKQLPEYQYTPYTTEAAKRLGQIFAEFPGMREAGAKPGDLLGPAARALSTPILIENYLRSWTGGMGVYALNIADGALKKAGVLPDPIKPTDTLADVPFVKAFVVRYPSANAQVLQDFYDEHGRNKRYYDTWQAKAKEGDEEALARIQAAGGPQMFLRMDAIQRVLGEHAKIVRDVYRHPTMKPEEKRQLIDSTYYAMIELARGGKAAMKGAKALTP